VSHAVDAFVAESEQLSEEQLSRKLLELNANYRRKVERRPPHEWLRAVARELRRGIAETR
jgi:hypothetical protein